MSNRLKERMNFTLQKEKMKNYEQDKLKGEIEHLIDNKIAVNKQKAHIE